MKIKRSTVSKLTLTGLMDDYHLDPVCVFLEDYGTGRGKVTVECYGKAWSAFWPAMGDDTTVQEFFISADPEYIAGKFGNTQRTINDWDAITKAVQEHSMEARPYHQDTISNDVDLSHHEKDLAEIYGADWFMDLPQVPCPDHQYLCRIIRAAQDGVRLAMQMRPRDVQEVPTGFLDAVKGMREAQRGYFKTRDQAALNTSKALEKQVDHFMDSLERPGLF